MRANSTPSPEAVPISLRPARLWFALAPLRAALDWPTLLAFGFPFILYLTTLAPTIYNLDSAELTTAAATGGLVRATGYPLYLLLGRFWSWLPIGDVGYRMNLFSAVCGALTITLAERILRRFQVGAWARLGALGLLACAPYFWALSLIAEVYTLHTALMAGVILLLLRYRDRPTPGRLALAVFLLSLSLGNHAATVLLVPGAVWFVLAAAPRSALQPRSLLLAAGAVLAGLSVYLYLPILYSTQPVFNYVGTYDASGTFRPVNLHTLPGMWWLVSGRAFAGQMWGYALPELWSEVSHFVAEWWRAFFAIGIGPGLLGVYLHLRRDRAAGGMLLLMFLANAAFYVSYRVVDKNTMFLPVYLVWALWLGMGYQALLRWLQAEGTEGQSRGGVWLLRGAMTVAVVVVAVWNWPLVNLSDDWSARRQGETILKVVEPDAIVLGWWDTVPVVEYLQLVEGQRPDVLAINRFLIDGSNMLELIERELGRRPLYIDAPPAFLPDTIQAVPVGPVYQLRPHPVLFRR